MIPKKNVSTYKYDAANGYIGNSLVHVTSHVTVEVYMCIILFRNGIEYTIYPSEIGKRHNDNNGLQVSSQNAIWNTREKNFKYQEEKKKTAPKPFYTMFSVLSYRGSR